MYSINYVGHTLTQGIRTSHPSINSTSGWKTSGEMLIPALLLAIYSLLIDSESCLRIDISTMSHKCLVELSYIFCLTLGKMLI